MQIARPERKAAGDRFRCYTSSGSEPRGLYDLTKGAEALQVADEPDVAQHEDLSNRQIRVTDGPAELGADLIDSTQEGIIQRR